MEKTEVEVQVEHIDVERAAKACHQQSVPSTRCLSLNPLLWIVVNVVATVTIVRKFIERNRRSAVFRGRNAHPKPFPSPRLFA